MQVYSLEDSAGNTTIAFEQAKCKSIGGLSLFVKPLRPSVNHPDVFEIPIVTGFNGCGIQRALMQEMAMHINAFGIDSLYDDDETQYEIVGASFGICSEYILVTHRFSDVATLHEVKAKLRAQLCEGQRLVDTSHLTAIDNLPSSVGVVFEKVNTGLIDITSYCPIDNPKQYGCINKFFKENYQTDLMTGFVQRMGVVLNRTVETK